MDWFWIVSVALFILAKDFFRCNRAIHNTKYFVLITIFIMVPFFSRVLILQKTYFLKCTCHFKCTINRLFYLILSELEIPVDRQFAERKCNWTLKLYLKSCKNSIRFCSNFSYFLQTTFPLHIYFLLHEGLLCRKETCHETLNRFHSHIFTLLYIENFTRIIMLFTITSNLLLYITILWEKGSGWITVCSWSCILVQSASENIPSNPFLS